MCVLIIIAFLSVSQPALSQIKYNEDLKKSDMDTEEAMEYHLQELTKDPYLKEHFKWKLFFAQHPMYLLIDEDRGEPPVGERIPPWKAKTKEEYVERVRRNLKSLDELPELKLNYQWSALELEDLCKNFSDIYEWMKRHYKRRSLDFLDGTYSQAHLQVLTSESNWRQFEYGIEIYKDLFDKKVDLYARQETGLHIQLPQLLRIFGYKYAAIPAFIATVEIIDGSFEFIIQEGRMEAINGEEFITAVAPDGSTIPFYLQIELGWDNMSLEREFQQDLYSSPKIFNVFPDLDEVDKELFEENYRLFNWVLFRDALEESYIVNPPRATALVYSNFSYNEGVWAEELFRAMRKAESYALLVEQMNAMVHLNGSNIDKTDELKEIWKTILKSQHHDISWIEVTDLKRKSINRLKAAIDKCYMLMYDLSSELVNADEKTLSVFNGLAMNRNGLVELEEGSSLLNFVFQDYRGRSYGFVDLPSGGFNSFTVSNKSISSKEEIIPENINTKYYRIDFSNEGLIKQIKTKGGNKLLKESDKLGGEIRARIDRMWYDNKTADVKYFAGEVFDIVERKTSINNIPLNEIYIYYKHQPYIKVELEFDFNGDEVGYMWFDETKLNVYYSTLGNVVRQDIPFGYKEAKMNRPLFPTSWIECGGLVYVHRGTVKHWVKDGTIANVLAWGDNQFTNRLHWDWIEYTEYDIRLYGKQKIEYYIIPLDEFDGNEITHIVDDIISPVFITSGNGEKSFYSQEDYSMSITSVYVKDGKVWMRGYQMPEGNKKYNDWEIFNTPVDMIK
jgi:hypothetical protein